MKIRYLKKDGKYLLVVNNCINKSVIAKYLKIPNREFEKFLKVNGGKLKLDENIYFDSKQEILFIIEQLKNFKR